MSKLTPSPLQLWPGLNSNEFIVQGTSFLCLFNFLNIRQTYWSLYSFSCLHVCRTLKAIPTSRRILWLNFFCFGKQHCTLFAEARLFNSPYLHQGKTDLLVYLPDHSARAESAQYKLCTAGDNLSTTSPLLDTMFQPLTWDSYCPLSILSTFPVNTLLCHTAGITVKSEINRHIKVRNSQRPFEDPHRKTDFRYGWHKWYLKELGLLRGNPVFGGSRSCVRHSQQGPLTLRERSLSSETTFDQWKISCHGYLHFLISWGQKIASPQNLRITAALWICNGTTVVHSFNFLMTLQLNSLSADRW